MTYIQLKANQKVISTVSLFIKQPSYMITHNFLENFYETSHNYAYINDILQSYWP